jgi:hypothetical protein
MLSSMPSSSGSPQLQVTNIQLQKPDGTPCTAEQKGCASVFTVKGAADFVRCDYGGGGGGDACCACGSDGHAICCVPDNSTATFRSISGLNQAFLIFTSGLNNFNSIPVKFFAQALPSGLKSTSSYYLRAHGTGLALGDTLSAAPLSSISQPSPFPTDLVMAFPAFNSCPFVSICIPPLDTRTEWV